MKSISIIIPVFNMGKFLYSAVESIVNQKFANYEIIIVNDGSTDDTKIIANNLILEFGAIIRVLEQPNLGLAIARNNGIAIADGKYIIPLDADNKLADGYFRYGVSILETDNKIDIVYGDVKYFGDKSNYLTQKHFDITDIILGNYIDACAIYRKEVWDRTGGYDSNMPEMGHEDWEFWIHAYLKGFKFHHLNELCFYYNVRNDSMLRTITNLKLSENCNYIYEKHGKSLFPEIISNYKILKNKNLHLNRRLEWYEKNRIKGALKLLLKPKI